MLKRILSITVSILMVLTMVSCSGGVSANSEATVKLESKSVGNNGAVITAELINMPSNAELSAVSADESIAIARVEDGKIIVTGMSGAVGTVKITVTATEKGGATRSSAVEVPIGYTTFAFDGNSVTVIEGSDDKYEIVGLNPADELEHDLTVSTDADGNTVYTNTDEATLSAAIKKSGGTYVFTGNCTDGGIVVKKESTGDAFILLNNLTMTSSFTSPITIKKDSTASVVITALEGTVNTLNDTQLNNADVYGPIDDGGDETNQYYAESAVIKAKTGATVYINGAGELNINGAAKNGIKTGESSLLEISELNLNIDVPHNGISSENEIIIRSGVFDVTTAANDAIKAEDDTGYIGTITVTGGDFTINSADEGLVAADKLNIYGGTFDIVSAGDAVKAENIDETDGDIAVYGGSFTINSVCDGFQSGGELTILGGEYNIICCGGHSNTAYDKDTDPSAKGIKSVGDAFIYGGIFNIDAADDAIQSKQNLTIMGGNFTLSTGDDGVHADYILTLGESGGDDSLINLTINDSLEGIEGATILGYSGVYNVFSSDDCINAANSDLTGYAYTLRIYGGEFYCHGSIGDGVDSNGELSVYGGTLEIFAPGSGNSAIDSDGALNLIGGSVLGVGRGDMVQTPSSGLYITFGGGGWGGSIQDGQQGRPGGMGGNGGKGENGGSVAANFTFNNGDTIAIYNSSNEKIYETVVSYYGSTQAANHVTFASPTLVSGQTYYLYKNGTNIDSTTARGTQGTVPDTTEWLAVGEMGDTYNRVTSMPTGIGCIITGTSSGYALTGGQSISGTSVTVTPSGEGYSIEGTSSSSTWVRDANGRLHCSAGGTDYYLAYTSTGGWNPTYNLALVTDETSAPSWNASASGSYARLSTTVAGGGFPGGGGRTLYLTASGTSFALTTGSSNLYIYAPDCAQAVLTGRDMYFVNLDNGETITEDAILSGLELRFRSGINAPEESLSWTDERVSLAWNHPFDPSTAGEYSMDVNVLGTTVGTVDVTIISPNAGGGAPSPDVPEPPVGTGDVDGDGFITVSDALQAMRHAVEVLTLSDEQIAIADMDGDGIVTVSDALIITRTSLGL